jgi:hypothetical protein
MAASATRCGCVPRCGRGLLARQHHQLLHQAGGTVDAGLQPAGCAGTGLVVARAAQGLYLQLQRRQRRAQLMGGIGHEALLRFEGLAHAVKEPVELVYQRADLVGQTVLADRLQVGTLTLGELAPHPRHRCQRAGDHPPHDEHQQRRHQRGGQHGAQRQRARHLAAHGQVLRHLHHLAAGLHGQHPVARAARLHLGKPQHRALRQRRPAAGLVDAQAVGGPDLHHEFIAGPVRGVLAGHARAADRQSRAQRQRHLLHVVVEDLVGLGQRRAVGKQALCGRAQQDGGQQQPQQPRAQRVRG